MKTAELMAIIERLDQTNTLLAAQNSRLDSEIGAIKASLRSETVQTVAADVQTTSTPDQKAKTGKYTDAQKESKTVVSYITGTVSYIAKSNTGLQFKETGKDWHNVRKDGAPIYSVLKIGQEITLGLNEAGRVATMATVTAESKATTTAKKATGGSRKAASLPASVAPQVATLDAAADATKISKSGEVRPPCPCCKGEMHNNYSQEEITKECLLRQYVLKTGKPRPSETDPEAMVEYYQWIAANRPLTVFSHCKSGFKVVGAPTTDTSKVPTTPVQEVTSDEIDAKLEASKAAKDARRAAKTETTPEAATTPSAAVKAQDVTIKKPADLKEGDVFSGFLSKHSRNTPGLLRFVSAQTPGHDGNGIWLMTREAIIPGILKVNPNDKIAIKIGTVTGPQGGEVLGIHDAKLLSTVEKDTGVAKGVQNSGKQDAPAPTPPARDEVVDKAKKARSAARKAAQVKRDAALAAGEAISA